jgi:hypothetical protein
VCGINMMEPLWLHVLIGTSFVMAPVSIQIAVRSEARQPRRILPGLILFPMAFFDHYEITASQNKGEH